MWQTVATGALAGLVGVLAYLGREVRTDVRALQQTASDTRVTLAKITTHLGIEG